MSYAYYKHCFCGLSMLAFRRIKGKCKVKPYPLIRFLLIIFLFSVSSSSVEIVFVCGLFFFPPSVAWPGSLHLIFEAFLVLFTTVLFLMYSQFFLLLVFFYIAACFILSDAFKSTGPHHGLKWCGAAASLSSWLYLEMFEPPSTKPREMWSVNFLAGADEYYNSSDIDEMVLIDTLADDALYSFTSLKCCGAGVWINWGVKRLSKESVCRSSAFMQGFKAYLIQFILPSRKLLFPGEYEVLARYRVWLRVLNLLKMFKKSRQQKSVGFSVGCNNL